MKKFYFKQLLATLLLLCSAIASAHDFEVGGIYYNITSRTDNTVAVTFKSSSYYGVYSGAVSIPASVTYNGTTYSVTAIGGGAFSGCSGLTSVEIPEGVTNISTYAFDSCRQLASITIPNSVTSIGNYAFNLCSSLKTVINYSNLRLTKGSSNYGYVAYYADNVINVPNGSVEGDFVFRIIDEVNTLCQYLGNETSIVLPQNYKGESYIIGNSAFEGCYALESIVIPNNVTSIGDWAFYNCDGLNSIEIPNSVTSIGNNVFYSCSGLTSIEIPNSVTSIGNYAFEGCYSLKSIVIPNSVTSIGYDAFGGCDGLTSIEIPNSVTSIGSYAFYNCKGLTSIEIPNSVTNIGVDAFYNCKGLKSITSLIPAENLFAIDCNTFQNVDKNACTLYVPYGAKETYAATEGWSEFTNIKEIIEEPFALTVSAARYATLYLDYDAVIPAGVRVYYAEKIEGETLLMERINDVIPANTGVIVTGAAGTYKFDQAFEEVAAIENNLFQGSVEDTYITPEKGTKYYVLSMVDGVVGMYLDELAGGTFKNNAHKAYLPIFTGESFGIFDTTVNAPDVQLSNRYTFNFGGVTAVESITATAPEEPVIYNLNGQRVENATKGIYIVNGKKVIY